MGRGGVSALGHLFMECQPRGAGGGVGMQTAPALLLDLIAPLPPNIVLHHRAQGLPKLPRLVDEATPGCFASQLVGFDLYVDMIEGEILSKAGQLSSSSSPSRETQSTNGIDDASWLRNDGAEAVDGSMLEVARVTAGMPDTVHVFAELLATFSVRQLGPLETLEQNLMCVPIDEGARPIKFGWKLHAYVGGLTDKHIAKLEAGRDDNDDTLDITLLPTALLPHATKRLLVDKPRWKVVDAFRL